MRREFFEAFVVFKINKKLCDNKNEVIYNKRINISSKDLTHVKDVNVPGGNKIVFKLKKSLKFFKGIFSI